MRVFHLLFLFVLSQPLAFADQVDKTTIWAASPAKVTQGNSVDVILTAPTALCGTAAGELNDAWLDNTTVKPTVTAQAGFSVNVTGIKHTGSKCELTASVAAAANAMTGPMRLTITTAGAAAAGSAQDAGYSTITILSSQASAIPDGLAPQVDVDYEVLPYQTAYDNYGRRIADQFYVVIPRIGNNTGFSLQLSGIGFGKTPTGNTNPSIVQGSLVYGQDYSARNVIYRSLIWAAIIGAGVTPYFHSPNAKANYATGLALFSGPVVSGFAQQFPDNTIKQLTRLGDSKILGDQNVIPNNTQMSFVAFVARDSVCSPVGTKPPAVCGVRHTWSGNTFYDPTAVKAALGDITIAGNLLPTFAARIKVTSNANQVVPPTTGIALATATVGLPSTIDLQSTGLIGATLTNPPAGITDANVVTDTTFRVSANFMSAPQAPVNVTLTRKDGSSVTIPITVVQPQPVLTLPANTTTIPATGATNVMISWKGAGPDLTAVVPTMAAADGVFAKTGSTATTISGTITPARAGALTITLPIMVGGQAVTGIPTLSVTAQ